MTTPSEEVVWSPDRELPGLETTTIPLPDATTFAGEESGSLNATLVRTGAPASKRALLYIHGWSDYFFQTHLAERMESMGYDFRAIDLRRYGRSLRPGHLAGFITDLSEYFVELDRAMEIIRAEGHDQVVLMGHSTGGLIAALYADARPRQFEALVLNSPWLEMQSYAALRPAMSAMLGLVGNFSPTASLAVADNGFYQRAISASEGGEWNYNVNLKGDKAFIVRTGWLAAVMAGHAKVAAGLSIDVPVLSMISSRSDFRRKWDDALLQADIVLDVDRIAARTAQLGSHVTLVRVADAMHDLALSGETPRQFFFDQLRRWLVAFGGAEPR